MLNKLVGDGKWNFALDDCDRITYGFHQAEFVLMKRLVYWGAMDFFAGT